MLALELCPPKHRAGHSRQRPEKTLKRDAYPILSIHHPSPIQLGLLYPLCRLQAVHSLSTACNLSSFSQGLCSGEEKLEHLTGPRAKVQNWLLCMIDEVKAAQGAANDMQGAGVKLWSLIMMYLCPHRQWKAGLGGQEVKWCLGAAAWL